MFFTVPGDLAKPPPHCYRDPNTGIDPQKVSKNSAKKGVTLIMTKNVTESQDKIGFLMGRNKRSR